MLLYAVFIVLIGSRDPSLFLLSVSANICHHRRGLAPPTRGSGVGARARLALRAGAMSNLPALRRARLGTAGQAAGPCRGSRLLARRGTRRRPRSCGAAPRARGGPGAERGGPAAMLGSGSRWSCPAPAPSPPPRAGQPRTAAPEPRAALVDRRAEAAAAAPGLRSESARARGRGRAQTRLRRWPRVGAGSRSRGKALESFLPKEPIYLASLPLPLGSADSRERRRHPPP